MTYDASGIYTLPNTLPIAANSEIISSQVNSGFSDIATALNSALLRNGAAAMTGPLTLSGAPTNSLHAATKAYVDAKFVFTSPNFGTTGAVQLRDATGNPDAVFLQATNNAGSLGYATIWLRANGVAQFFGSIGFSDGSTQSSAGIGYSQTWQVVNGSRALATTYTNSTGRPIMVSVMCGGNALTDGIVAGNLVYRSWLPTPNTNTNVCFIVPNGATYRVESSGGLSTWAELR